MLPYLDASIVVEPCCRECGGPVEDEIDARPASPDLDRFLAVGAVRYRHRSGGPGRSISSDHVAAALDLDTGELPQQVAVPRRGELHLRGRLRGPEAFEMTVHVPEAASAGVTLEGSLGTACALFAGLVRPRELVGAGMLTGSMYSLSLLSEVVETGQVRGVKNVELYSWGRGADLVLRGGRWCSC